MQDIPLHEHLHCFVLGVYIVLQLLYKYTLFPVGLYYDKMADNSARIPTSEIHSRSTVATSDAIRDLLLGTQNVPPPDNSFEPRSLADAAHVSMGGHQALVDSATPDPHRGTAPHAGVGAAANSVSTSRQMCQY